MREDQAIVIGDILLNELSPVHDIEEIDGVEIGTVLLPNSILTVRRDPDYDREAFQWMKDVWKWERHPVWVCVSEEAYEEA